MATRPPAPERTFNQRFFDALLAHQIYLLRYSGFVRNRVIGFLNKTESRIADLLRSRLAGKPGLATPSDYRRLEAVADLIKEARKVGWKAAMDAMKEDLTQLARAEPLAVQAMVVNNAPVVLQMAIPAAEQLDAIVTARPFQGRVLRDWASTMEADDLARIMGAVQQGMVAGQSAPSIARMVVGTARLDGADGITEMTRRNVQSIVRTAVAHVAGNARELLVQANDDIFEDEQFIATLDARTTAVCRGQDGKRFPIGEGPHPPLHYQCRSLRVPVIGDGPMSERPARPFTERQLLEEYTTANNLPEVSKRDQLPRGTKTAYDDFARQRKRELTGRVPSATSYQQWMGTQSVEFQNEVLGKTKARLFREGKLPLDRFTNRNGDELTLGQLAKLEADAFKRAGLNPEDYL